MEYARPKSTATASSSAATGYDSLPTRRSLLSRLRNMGDDDSWRAFFDAYWRLIYNVARKSGLSDEDAQDVVQETVISVAKKMPEFRYDPAKGSFKSWLLIITHRRIHDRLRRHYQSVPTANLSAAENMPANVLSPDGALQAAWEEEWQKNIFQAALARVRQQVNPKHFQVFDYCLLQNMRASEVARRLGLTSAQVYLNKHRMMLAVKRAVKEVEAEMEHTK